MRLEAEIALAEGDAASAAERFEAALSLGPDWIVALSGLAQLRYAEGNLEQAERHLLEAMKSRDHSPTRIWPTGYSRATSWRTVVRMRRPTPT